MRIRPKDAQTHPELAGQAKGYVEKVLHRPVRLGRSGLEGEFPELAGRYVIVEAAVGHQACYLLFPSQRLTSGQLTADAQAAGNRFGAPAYPVLADVSSTDRARLIELGTGFIVPGNQIYLPELALDLREIFRQPVVVRKGGLSPAAQVTFFHLASQAVRETTPTELVKGLPFTAMSIGRAFDELGAHGIATAKREGREKVLRLSGDLGSLIRNHQHLLTPPQRGVYAAKFHKRRPKMLLAHTSALAAWTGEKDNGVPTFAISGSERQSFFAEHGIESLPDQEGADALIETWRYDPSILADGRKVDRLSLYAQFHSDPDPRLRQVSEKLLREALG